jgi:hypothetical protein
MESRKNRWCLGLVVALLLGAVSCSGILQESHYEDGKVERLRIQGGVSWKTWDHNSIKQDESAFILKKEATF